MRMRTRELVTYPWSLIPILMHFGNREGGNYGSGDWSLKRGWNDDWLNCYAYLWLNPSFVSFFYCMSILLLCGCYTFKPYCILILPLLFLEIKYQMFSTWMTIGDKHCWMKNSLLSNHLNWYHPPFFFASFIGIIRSYWYFGSMIKNKISGWRGNYMYFYFRELRYRWCFASWMLLLGGWWAYQEGNWGGWWNWDPSEFLALLIGLKIIFSLHESRNLFLSVLTFFRMFELSNFILILFVFIQLNFELTSHNFGLRVIQLFDSNGNFLGLLVITICNQIYSFNHLYWRTLAILFHDVARRWFVISLWYLFWFIPSIVFYYVHFSCNFIINYFCWFFWMMNFPFFIQVVSVVNISVISLFVFTEVQIRERSYLNVVSYGGWMSWMFFRNINFGNSRRLANHSLALFAALISFGFFYEIPASHFYWNWWSSSYYDTFERGTWFANNIFNEKMRLEIENSRYVVFDDLSSSVRALWALSNELLAIEIWNYSNIHARFCLFDDVSSVLMMSGVMAIFYCFGSWC